MVNLQEAKAWSVERLKFEIGVLQERYESVRREYRELQEDYDAETPDSNPGAFDSDGSRLADAAPIGLYSLPGEMEKIKSQIEALRNILRSRL
jgi:hypothetical protein